MNVSLTPQLETLIRSKVETGRYHSASEVVREGLRLLEQRDEERAAKLQALRHELSPAITELDEGKGEALDIESITAAGRKRMKKA
jgi:antitoxin ParD1/3/4